MAHCPFDKLSDLNEILGEIRELSSVKEPKAGIFYLKAKGFLHFHIDKQGSRRWADIRDGKDWGTEVEIPFGASKTLRSSFLKVVKERHASSLNGK